jgi:hypothetical protein
MRNNILIVEVRKIVVHAIVGAKSLARELCSTGDTVSRTIVRQHSTLNNIDGNASIIPQVPTTTANPAQINPEDFLPMIPPHLPSLKVNGHNTWTRSRG